ncbi:MAG: hypothetical protein JWP02_2752 [Acidimicrobiales bacterium]|nr:hypothetical protein [Acidimicrobiales bacterium]
MRFTVDQPIAAPCERVEQAFVDPAFYATLAAMPNIGEPQVLERTESDGLVELRVRYAFTGDLAPAARRVLDPAKLTWVVESSIDRASRTTTFRMVPDNYRDRLDCNGTYTLRPDGPARTVQHTEGELRVHFPVVGKLAERGIVTGLKEHLAQEAAVLEQWLR